MSNLSLKMNNQDVGRFEHQVEDMYSILVNISSELVNIKVSKRLLSLRIPGSVNLLLAHEYMINKTKYHCLCCYSLGKRPYIFCCRRSNLYWFLPFFLLGRTKKLFFQFSFINKCVWAACIGSLVVMHTEQHQKTAQLLALKQ